MGSIGESHRRDGRMLYQGVYVWAVLPILSLSWRNDANYLSFTIGVHARAGSQDEKGYCFRDQLSR